MKIVCTSIKRFFNKKKYFPLSYTIIPINSLSVKKKQMRRHQPPQRKSALTEGLTVSALIHSRIGLVGTHQDPVQGAIVLVIAVVSALLDGAFDALVCVVVHCVVLLFIDFYASMFPSRKIIQDIFVIVAIPFGLW